MWVDATLDFEFEGNLQGHKGKLGVLGFSMHLDHIHYIYPKKTSLLSSAFVCLALSSQGVSRLRGGQTPWGIVCVVVEGKS